MTDLQYGPWRKTSRSDGGQNCVEVSDAVDGSAARVRDSKDQAGPVLSFTGRSWAAFIDGAKAGAFNLD